jgi:DNA-binding response OmpR family regulator
LRRARRFTLGGIVFDTATRQAFAQGRPLELTRREAALLEEFLRAPGHILAKAGSTNALEAAVSRLRRKLTAAAVALQIETRWGIGYCLTEVAPE